MELGPNLFSIGNDLVAVHLVATPDGLTLIDAGMPGQYGDLQAELRRIGRRPGDIRGLVLTHGDSDHIGFAERLRSDANAGYVHAADAARARGEDKPKQSWGKVGRPDRVVPDVRPAKGALRTPPLGEVSTFEDAAVLDLPGQPRVIAMPGHSPGSVALHVPDVRAVFVGDALTTRNVLTGAGGPGPAPFTDAPETAAESLARLADLDVDWVIPGHGPAWHGGVPALMDAYRAAAGVRPYPSPTVETTGGVAVHPPRSRRVNRDPPVVSPRGASLTGSGRSQVTLTVMERGANPLPGDRDLLFSPPRPTGRRWR